MRSSKSRISSSSEWKWIRTVPPAPRRTISTRVWRRWVSRSAAAAAFGSGSRRVARRPARPSPPASRSRSRAESPSATARRASASCSAGLASARSGRAWPAESCPSRRSALHLVRQLQEAQGVGDRRPALPHPLRDLVLGQPELLLQDPIGLGLFQRVEVGALQVLDQRQLQELAVLPHRAHHDRHRLEAGPLRGAPAALAGDDRVGAVAVRRDQEGLQDPLRPHRGGELLERRLVDAGARLAAVGVQRGHRQDPRRLAAFEEGVEAASQTALADAHAARRRNSRARAR